MCLGLGSEPYPRVNWIPPRPHHCFPHLETLVYSLGGLSTRCVVCQGNPVKTSPAGFDWTGQLMQVPAGLAHL